MTQETNDSNSITVIDFSKLSLEQLKALDAARAKHETERKAREKQEKADKKALVDALKAREIELERDGYSHKDSKIEVCARVSNGTLYGFGEDGKTAKSKWPKISSAILVELTTSFLMYGEANFAEIMQSYLVENELAKIEAEKVAA